MSLRALDVAFDAHEDALDLAARVSGAAGPGAGALHAGGRRKEFVALAVDAHLGRPASVVALSAVQRVVLEVGRRDADAVAVDVCDTTRGNRVAVAVLAH